MTQPKATDFDQILITNGAFISLPVATEPFFGISGATSPYPVVYFVPGTAHFRSPRHQLSGYIQERCLMGEAATHMHFDSTGIADNHRANFEQPRSQCGNLRTSKRRFLQVAISEPL